MSSELFQDFMDGYMKYYHFSQQQLSVVIVTIGNLEDSNTVPVSGQFLILVLSYLCSVAVGDMKSVILVEDSDSAYCFG